MQTEEQKKKKRKKTRNTVLALMVLLAAVWWGMTLVSSPSGTTGTAEIALPSLICNLQDYTATVQPLLEEWDDAVSLANQTSRMNLSDRIADLQNIKRRVANLEIDKCFKDAHPFLIKSMGYTIEGFAAFMSQKADHLVTAKFDLAETSFETYLLRLKD